LLIFGENGERVEFELPSHPFCGEIMDRGKVLGVGCEGEFLAIINIENPLQPETIRNVWLQARVTSLLKLSENLLLCG
jgi:hypothetical protein